MAMHAANATFRPILLVEDNNDIRTAIKVLLELEGYRVETASDGAAALQALRGGLDAGLILLDLAMPGKDGLQFRAEQRQDPALAHIPVIIYSGASNVGDTAASLGVVAFFHKPIEVDRILKLVAEHCLRQAGA
jgi:CheY-like chemotaxis protein